MKKPSAKGLKRFKNTKWGRPAPYYRHYYRKDMPKDLELIVMGEFLGVVLDTQYGKLAITSSPKTVKDCEADGEFNLGKCTIIPFGASENNMLAFDMQKPEKLFIVLTESAQAVTRELYEQWDAPVIDYQKLQEMVGGIQAKRKLPYSPQVKPIGFITHTIYLTDKVGDGLSVYIHEQGDEGGQQPVLGIDKAGHMFVAGGDYTVPHPGITD